jgi:hypothetical protein
MKLRQPESKMEAAVKVEIDRQNQTEVVAQTRRTQVLPEEAAS